MISYRSCMWHGKEITATFSSTFHGSILTVRLDARYNCVRNIPWCVLVFIPTMWIRRHIHQVIAKKVIAEQNSNEPTSINDNQLSLANWHSLSLLETRSCCWSHFIMTNKTRIKWSKNGTAALHLLDLLKNQEVDPSNIKRDYILRLKDQHPVFQPYAVDRFVANVRKLFREFSLEKSLQGRRQNITRKSLILYQSVFTYCVHGWL